MSEIRGAVRNKYAGVSASAAGKFQYPTGVDGAAALGYNPAFIESAGRQLLESFCGVGNPFSLGEIKRGDAVLDFGSGGGFDLFVTSRLVGEDGRACGVDLTSEMAKKAEESLKTAGISNFEIKTLDSEELPYPDHSFDVVISNGVINLSPRKDVCFRELYRVLKPGGKIQFADVVLDKELPAALSDSLEAWSQ